MQRRFDVVQDRRGNAIGSANVYVRETTGALATIFSNDGDASESNPLTTNSDGEYSFFAPNGKYDIEIVAEGYATETISDQVLFDPTDLTAQAIIDYGYVPIIQTSSTSYNVGTANYGCWLDVDTSGTANVSLPTGGFADGKGASLIIRQKGAGQVVVAASGGASLTTASTAKTRAQYSVIAAQAVGTSTWTVFGDME